MARRRDRTASRDAGFTRLLIALTLGGAGIAGGILLGDVTVGNGLRGSGSGPSYAALSANPDALTADSIAAPDCIDCPGSYGAAARLRAIHAVRSDESFRKLGAVEIDYPPIHQPTDDYVYGGRFPDRDPAIASERAPIVAALDGEMPETIPAPELPHADAPPVVQE